MFKLESLTIIASISFLLFVYSSVGRANDDLVPSALVGALQQSQLLSGVSGNASAKEVLGHLEHITQAPLNTPLQIVHELNHGNVSKDVRNILEKYPTLNKRNLAEWLALVNSFLESYAHGSSTFHHGSARVVLNNIALSALPMIRRAFLAQFTIAWITTLDKALPAELLPPTAHLIRQFYYMHRFSVQQRGVMEYFHISKAGGTSWTSAAKMNGCVYARGAGGHVTGFGDECRWMDPEVYGNVTGGLRIMWSRWGRVDRSTPHRGCRQRYDHVRHRGFSFISNEYTLHGGHEDMRAAHVCPQVVNVVTLRNPVRRMESNIKFIMMYVKHAYRRRDQEYGGDDFDSLFCNASAAFWQALGPPITDNYIVRSFLGERGFHSPVGSLGEQHLSLARHQLLTFDMVMDLEAGEEENDRMAEQGLGWPATLSRAHALDSSVLTTRMDLNYSTCHPDPGGMEILKQAQAVDMQLYSFGRVVSQLDGLWLDMARALGLHPLPHVLSPDASPESKRCGLLWRGANTSALSEALGPVAHTHEAAEGVQGTEVQEREEVGQGYGERQQEAGEEGGSKEEEKKEEKAGVGPRTKYRYRSR